MTVAAKGNDTANSSNNSVQNSALWHYVWHYIIRQYGISLLSNGPFAKLCWFNYQGNFFGSSILFTSKSSVPASASNTSSTSGTYNTPKLSSSGMQVTVMAILATLQLWCVVFKHNLTYLHH